ncbi:MAG TPA: hypothetical protein VFI71_11440, partial [Pyrinomonadaceae bacterium]|nr:hypothetical protein [Pyrinomonadaceae bacterium]
MKRLLPFIIILLVLGVALGSIWYVTRTTTGSPTTSTPSQPSPASASAPAPQPVVNKGIPGAEPPHTLGPATAPIKLEEFGDFE